MDHRLQQSFYNNLDEQPQRDNKHDTKSAFYLGQLIDAIAPTNFLLTNPEVYDETISSGGLNLINGLEAFLQDLIRGKGALALRSTDTEAFELGENIASSAGEVVYENDIMQLLQYLPTTDTVFTNPLLIVPPWINKYYILDLRPENSFIAWAVNQGYTVFVVSWVNPDKEQANLSFENYLVDGLLMATEQIIRLTKQKTLTAIGYCLGGTLLACANAYLAAKGDKRLRSSTYFTSLLDFSEPGDIGVFIDEEQLVALERRMQQDGYLDGLNMAMAFNMLRANDLIWPFFINNYLLGKKPMPFDLLYWNSDSTRMPAAMHSFYLRKLYHQNLLQEPGAIVLDDVAIDLGTVTTPSYFLATKDDHIAPWQSVFKGSQSFSGPVRFALGQSGHIAGVINPPAANKYGYWSATSGNDNADDWKASAQYQQGSWWNDWHQWQQQYAGKKIPARQPAKSIEKAPGRYVRVRYNQPLTDQENRTESLQPKCPQHPERKQQ
jgi:polyhydroxyalkanoate synthase